jgi:hypothetical protein
MRPNLYVARICAAAIVLIAVALAPSMASAHAGHAHPATPVAQDKHEADFKSVSHDVTATLAMPSRHEDSTCGRLGCCSNSPCSGCHGGVLTAVSMPAPPFLGATLSGGDARAGPLPHNGRLRRPPKSFA